MYFLGLSDHFCVKVFLHLAFSFGIVILNKGEYITRGGHGMRFTKSMMILMIAVILLMACKPSEKYAGEWHAVSENGEEVIMNFDREEKLLTFTSSDGEKEVHEINQNAAGIKNKLQYFRIEIGEDVYYIIFKDRKNEESAEFVKQTNHASDYDNMVGEVLFTMSR